MSGLGFSASAWQRSIPACGLIVVGALLCRWSESPRAPVAAAILTQPATVDQAQVHLRIESSFPVAAWTVQRGGIPGSMSFSNSEIWEGQVSAAAGSELLVIATADPSAPLQRHALRLVLDGDPQGERSAWGDGDVVATVRLP